MFGLFLPGSFGIGLGVSRTPKRILFGGIRSLRSRKKRQFRIRRRVGILIGCGTHLEKSQIRHRLKIRICIAVPIRIHRIIPEEISGTEKELEHILGLISVDSGHKTVQSIRDLVDVGFVNSGFGKHLVNAANPSLVCAFEAKPFADSFAVIETGRKYDGDILLADYTFCHSFFLNRSFSSTSCAVSRQSIYQEHPSLLSYPVVSDTSHSESVRNGNSRVMASDIAPYRTPRPG